MYSYKNDIIKNSHVDCYERPPLATFDGGETEPSNDSPSSAPVRQSLWPGAWRAAAENDVVGISKATSGFRLSYVDCLTAY